MWVPLLGAVFVSCFHRGAGIRSLVHDLGLRIRPIDLLWGLDIGLLARVVASLLQIVFYGRMATGAPVLGPLEHDGCWLFGALLAPALLAPSVEELFFRGLLLRAVLGSVLANGGSRRFSVGSAVAVSALVFALAHVLPVGSVGAAVVVGVSTLVFGLAAASVAVLTGRLGAAIIAHVTFNALVVLPALL